MKNEIKSITKTDLPLLAQEVLRAAKNVHADGAVVIALHGDLGAGKTTFVQSLAHTLGVTEHVTSPTFTIMKGYETTDEVFQNLIHMDAYRIDDESELAPLRFGDILQAPGTLFCIEWAEKIATALPANIIHLTLNVVDENTRTVHLSYS
jgi:tRNA threonylcarbamoyladenosine biosynthesis protein TsaE